MLWWIGDRLGDQDSPRARFARLVQSLWLPEGTVPSRSGTRSLGTVPQLTWYSPLRRDSPASRYTSRGLGTVHALASLAWYSPSAHLVQPFEAGQPGQSVDFSGLGTVHALASLTWYSPFGFLNSLGTVPVPLASGPEQSTRLLRSVGTLALVLTRCYFCLIIPPRPLTGICRRGMRLCPESIGTAFDLPRLDKT